MSQSDPSLQSSVPGPRSSVLGLQSPVFDPGASAPALCVVSHQAYGAMTGGQTGHIGGVEWQTSLLAKWFAARGWRVSMLTWDEGGPPEEFIDGVRVIKICRQNAGLPGLRFFHPKWTGLIRAMRAANADVYYQNGAECVTGQVALWCKRNRRVFVFSVASDGDCELCPPFMRAPHERALYRYGLRNAHVSITQTQTQRQRMWDNFARPSIAIPMPCPGPAHWQPRIREMKRRMRVLWVGRFAPVKRPEWVLRLAAMCPEFDFLMVGPVRDERYVATIKASARDISNLDIEGPVPRDELAAYYRAADCLCCTSEYEGFPNVFLEAWSHGLPIVSSFDPDGLIRDKRLGLAGRTLEELAAGLRKMASSAALLEEMSKNARRHWQENHDPKVIFPQIEALLVNVVHTGVGSAGDPADPQCTQG